jgi:hypothetical protein
MTAVSKDNIHLYDHASYDILIEFSKQKIDFDIIIFYDDMSDDLFSQLILTFNLLKSNGILFIYQSENFNKNIDEFHKTIQLFTELKDTQIEILKQSEQYIFIRKQSISKIDKMESAKVKEALKNVLSTKMTQESLTLPQPTLKITDLQFELQTTDKPVKNMTKYGFIKEYDEYEDYIIHNKDNINSLDPKFMLLVDINDNQKIINFYNQLEKIKIKINLQIKNILHNFLIKNIHKIYSLLTILKTIKNKNNLSILNLSKFNLKSSTQEGINELFDNYPNLKITFYKPYFSNKNIKSTKKIKYIKSINEDYSFKNLESIKINMKNKVDVININLTSLIKKYNLKEYYCIISPILINLLYFIISTQKIHGICILNIPILSTKLFIEFLYILSIFYKNIKFTRSSVKYQNNPTIKIIASTFKNRSSNIKKYIKNICILYEKKIENNKNKQLFIHSFLLNNIPQSFINQIHKILHIFYKNNIQNIKNKIILLKYINDKYVIRKILNEQIKYSIYFNNYFNELKNSIL